MPMSRDASPEFASPSTSHADPLAGQRALLGRLEAASFPHAVDQISVIETHISFVILTGPFAYKIKKALALGFLDFGTLERRLFFCEEELRLNRRLAAPLYLDVVAIGGTPEVPRIGGGLPALEYAVRMVQFDQDGLLDTLMSRGQAEASDIDALAHLVAEFHHRLPRAQTPAELAYGTPEAVRMPMADNFTALRQVLKSPADMTLLDLLETWSRGQFAARESDMAARHRDGWVRECHGDLHLGNIVRLAEGPCVFDCLEFNPALRWIDVVSEIAFLVMDLSERGRPDFAYRFLNAYLEQTGDYGSLRLLPFYLVYRAMVRAKIAAIRAGQASLSTADRTTALAQVHAYLEFAQCGTTPRPPVILFTHGVSGSGKTRASQTLLERVPAVRLRSDVERKRLHDLPPLATSDSGIGHGLYDVGSTAATYHRLSDLTRQLVASGFSVVVDASFLQRWQRDLFRRLADELAVPFMIVHCEAPSSVLYARVAARQQQGGDASEAGAEVLARQLETAEPLATDEPSLNLNQALVALGAPS